MEICLKNKVIVVSGGTKGVGKSVIVESAKCGANVVIGGRDEISAQSILDEIRQYGNEGLYVNTDLKKTNDVKKLFDETLRKFGRVDGFYNYAGVTSAASLLDCDDDNFNSIFEVNVRAALFCCKYAIKIMKDNGGGSIVLNGSPHAWGGEQDRVAYACSKGALLTLTEHIARHYAEFGIRANYITMGWTPTEGELDLRKTQHMTIEELRALASSMIPAGRMTEIEDIVPGIIYLFSDFSKMVNGSNLRVTGGWYI